MEDTYTKCNREGGINLKTLDSTHVTEQLSPRNIGRNMKKNILSYKIDQLTVQFVWETDFFFTFRPICSLGKDVQLHEYYPGFSG